MSGQLNDSCLTDSDIVTGSVEVGCVSFPPPSRRLSWDDVKLTTFGWFVVYFLVFCCDFCFHNLNRLSTERKRWFSRRCPDAGVGLGFGVGVFGLSGGSSLAEVLYGTYY